MLIDVFVDVGGIDVCAYDSVLNIGVNVCLDVGVVVGLDVEVFVGIYVGVNVRLAIGVDNADLNLGIGVVLCCRCCCGSDVCVEFSDNNTVMVQLLHR